jgi:streptomycin 6-kinase
VTEQGHFATASEVVVEAARLERERLPRWILGWAGLSAVGFLSDGASAAIDLRVAELAAAEPDR